MCCKNFWKRIVPFALAVWLSLLAVNILQRENFAENGQEKSLVKVIYSEQGTGISGNSDTATGLPPFYNQIRLKLLVRRKRLSKLFQNRVQIILTRRDKIRLKEKSDCA